METRSRLRPLAVVSWGPLGDFSITGGKGKFSGAGGYVDYMIDAIDSEGVQYGFTHDIHVCSRPHQLE